MLYRTPFENSGDNNTLNINVELLENVTRLFVHIATTTTTTTTNIILSTSTEDRMNVDQFTLLRYTLLPVLPEHFNLLAYGLLPVREDVRVRANQSIPNLAIKVTCPADFHNMQNACF